MASTTRLATGDSSVPPSPSNLMAAFSPHHSYDSDDETEGEEDQPLNSKERSFKDSVHGWITLSERICRIIDTPQFQRLRHVKQLGTSYYVWPAASHNRFEHCLGVAHLALTQVKRLQQLQPELGITEQDIDCVTIAGLCHDLGHGPWSHVWDSLFIPKAMPNKKWKHEDASEMMFDYLCQEPTVDVTPEEAAVVKALIAGEPSRCPELEAKKFLFEIVANKRNGLDVDKFDYIARDCHAIGQGENVSLTKLIHSVRVIGGEICYNIKDANSVYELCWSRFSLHKRIYNHKTAKAIEYMIIDALLEAEPYMHIAEQIEDPKRYVHLTDDIKLRIQATTCPELEKARKIFYRIDTRDLYKWIEYKVYPWSVRDVCRERITPQTIVAAAKRITRESDENYDLACELGEEQIIVDLATLHYGMKELNPLRYVKFYSKRKPNRAKYAESGDISNIMPQAFAEVLLRVYTRDSRFMGLVQRGFRQVLADIYDDVKEARISLSDDEDPSTPRVGAAADAPSNQHGTPGAAGTQADGAASKRTLSRVSSLRLAPESDGEDAVTTPWTPNSFTDVPTAHARGRGASPTRARKRGADNRSPSPSKKRGRVAKE
ncbi:uncharacterized protein PHACADRAFT_249122 [Phanerochaete carnosa HHB-10118-sp]|uniref:HD/PDEase domain-containing protein n=1 Tax=Phanerochaete carnosa (strain HHB-10118-sp) TaxID=650164 RepID=K5WIP3_PHACS|nr:uncharacterized protein PHACADRAFT_249122 [Phanerochaete carnosa HHB-10118-sp]EKM58979.1 hypothetical protein PHACADRAFT_249122 [Phanerochaete carnosa HHB-10118-sp]